MIKYIIYESAIKERFMTSTLRISILFILTFNLFGCIDVPKEDESSEAQSSELESIKLQITNQLWQANNATVNDSAVFTTWRFYKTGKFSQKNSLAETNDVSSESEVDGSYSILGPITVISGHNVFELDLQFTDNHDPDIESAPAPFTLVKFDIIYIQNNTLYFGNERQIENCQDEQKTYANLTNNTSNHYDGVSSASTPIATLKCYGRPESLNFDNPYREIQ